MNIIHQLTVIQLPSEFCLLNSFIESDVPSFEWVHENRLFSFNTLTYLKMSISMKSPRKTHELPFFGLIERQSLHNPTKSGSNLAGVRKMEPSERCHITLPIVS